jgi:hypothetical protein
MELMKSVHKKWLWFWAQWINEIIKRVTENCFKQYLNWDFKGARIEWWTQDLLRKWKRKILEQTSNRSDADSNDWLWI